MGLGDILLGRKRLKEPARDRLFALTTAAVTLDVELGLKPAGVGAVVFKPLSAGEFNQVEADVEQLLQGVAADSGSTLERQKDTFGFEWVIVRDPDLEDEVTAASAQNRSLPAAIDAVLARSLAKEPDRRQTTAGQLLDEANEALGLIRQPSRARRLVLPGGIVAVVLLALTATGKLDLDVGGLGEKLRRRLREQDEPLAGEPRHQLTALAADLDFITFGAAVLAQVIVQYRPRQGELRPARPHLKSETAT